MRGEVRPFLDKMRTHIDLTIKSETLAPNTRIPRGRDLVQTVKFEGGEGLNTLMKLVLV